MLCLQLDQPIYLLWSSTGIGCPRQRWSRACFKNWPLLEITGYKPRFFLKILLELQLSHFRCGSKHSSHVVWHGDLGSRLHTTILSSIKQIPEAGDCSRFLISAWAKFQPCPQRLYSMWNVTSGPKFTTLSFGTPVAAILSTSCEISFYNLRAFTKVVNVNCLRWLLPWNEQQRSITLWITDINQV